MQRPTASRSIVRRTAVLGAALLALCLPSGATASAPIRIDTDSTAVFCQIADLGGTAGILVIDIDEPNPGIAFIAYDDGSVVSGAATVAATSDRSSISAAIELWTPDFDEFLGTATASLALTTTNILTLDSSDRGGNLVSHEQGFLQSLDVSGTLTLPDDSVIVIDPAACNAHRIVSTIFHTDPAGRPASFSATIRETLFACAWDTPLGPVELFVRSVDETGGQAPSGVQPIGRPVPGMWAFTSAEVLAPSGTDWTVFADNIVPDVRVGGRSIAYRGTFSIWASDADLDGPPSGSATASATLTPVEAFRSIDSVPGQTDQFHGHLLSVDGTLVIEMDGVLSLPMDDDSCFAIRGRNSQHWVTPGG